MYAINHDKQREYATRNNWILPLDGEVYYIDDPKRSLTFLKIQLDLADSPAPVFEEMNKKFWREYFAHFQSEELRQHIMKLGQYPGKNRGSLVAKLCNHYRRAVGA